MCRRTVLTTATLFVCATTALTACSGSGSGSAAPAATKSSPAATGSAPATPTATASQAPFAGRNAGQIFNDAVEQDLTSPTLRLKADINDAKDGPTKVDVAMDAKGDCAGTVQPKQGPISMIKAGKTIYLRPAGARAWAKVPTSSPDGKGMAQVCDLKGYLATPGRDTVDTKAMKGATTTVDGQPAITLTDQEGKEHFTAYVATSGKPYLLKLVTVGGDQPGTLDFSDFGRPVHAVAPPKSQLASG
ncbi:hypothetical protein ABZ734_30045 [Streptomyces sp. NPDC006660]|uniref:hypothetical protein n=1 Tax=Streptomyces sp. NPDC006660 TaxID=3156901 RepID=UPI0033CBD685